MSPTFHALIETVAPDASLDAAAWEEVARLRDATLASRSRLERSQLALLLVALEWSPVAVFGRPFSRLSPSRRAWVLDRLSRAPLRVVRAGAWGARTLALLCVYGRPAAWHDLGYRPDRRGWEALPRGAATT